MSLQTLERNSPSPQESESEDQGSLSSYEGFVCREGCAICLSPRPGASIGKHGGSLRIMTHLKKLVKIMRPQDAIRLAVELEKFSPRNVTRYMVVITTQGVQDTEETIVLGTEQVSDIVKVCLVLPLWRNTEIKLDGDGGFSVHSQDNHHIFKPCSVQSMWTALQYLFKATDQARTYNYYDGGLSHTWMMFYHAQLTEDGVALNEWSLQCDLESFRPDSPIYYDATGTLDWAELNANSEKETFKKLIVQKLREVMLHCDLEEVTSLQLRRKLEEEMTMDLKEYRGFLDQQMLVILGQLEKPSRIHEYLYLGSEWNASDLVELKDLGIEYILNVTREIDNFYPEAFKYKTIRVFDVPESELLMHWDDTYKFLKEVKEKKSKALVHCKMGVSRSAATVIAYTMKEYRMSLKEAHEHVKERRNCINPNHGFMNQLKAYEGILKARYNDLFGAQAPSRITYQTRSNSDPNLRQRLFQSTPDELEPSNAGYIPDNVNKSNLEEWHRCGSVNLRTYSNHINEYLENRATLSLPPEKAEGMVQYLASLEVPPLLHEEEQDLGINVPSCSESGSPFSSPLLTPPDEENIHHLLRAFQESERERLLEGKREANGEDNGEDEKGLEPMEDDNQLMSTDKDVTKISTYNTDDLSSEDRQPYALLDVSSSPSSPIPHSRVSRAASLPTPLRPSSASTSEKSYSRNYPVSPKKSSSIRSPSSSRTHGSQDHMNELAEVEDSIDGQDLPSAGDESEEGEQQVKTTLIDSVTARIKQIEEMNTRKNQRPSSPGNRNRMSISSLSHASSDESVNISPPRDEESLDPPNTNTSNQLSVFENGLKTNTLSPSPELLTILSTNSSNNTSDPSSPTFNFQTNSINFSSAVGSDSPNTRYRKATTQSAILIEQRRAEKQRQTEVLQEAEQLPNECTQKLLDHLEMPSLQISNHDLSASADDLRFHQSGKGVRQLLDIFDEQRKGGSLKRSHSLRSNKETDRSFSTHKRGVSSDNILDL